MSRTWVVTSALWRFDETSGATFSSSLMASSNSAVGIRSTIRERKASPSLSVSVSSSEMVPPWTSTTFRTSKIAWPTSSARSWTLPVEITCCCSTAVPPEASLLPDWEATSATPPAAASAPSAGAGASAALTAPLSLLAESPPPSSDAEQPLRTTRTTAAPAASAVRRKERDRRVATMATRTAARKGRFRAVSES